MHLRRKPQGLFLSLNPFPMGKVPPRSRCEYVILPPVRVLRFQVEATVELYQVFACQRFREGEHC